ncbi:DUF5360 family protein [Nakamurella aerolata]|uniref:DUF5360 family protein n=1 Tax=Nakamurella aerolata TaxID=1656892 RepID=UPI001BB1BC66
MSDRVSHGPGEPGRRGDQRVVRRIKTTMLWTDLGFLGYWLATAFGLLAVTGGELMDDWNWSFFGLDLVAIATGLTGLALARRRHPASWALMTVSLALTAAAGLMALNFLALRGDFQLAWWLPNAWLLLFPLVALTLLIRGGHLNLVPRSAAGPAAGPAD